MKLKQVYNMDKTIMIDAAEERQSILENDVFIVGGYVTKTLTTNNGLPHPSEMEELKREFLNYSTLHLVDELVRTKTTYPTNDTTEVQASADFVVMKREDFDKLLEL